MKAIDDLGELGATVRDVSISLIEDAAAISAAIIAVDAVGAHSRNIPGRLAEYDHNNRVRLLWGSLVPSKYHQKAVKLREILRRQILAALEEVDVLVMPTSSIPPSLIPEHHGINSKQEVLDGFAGRRGFTAPFNLASLPALSINCGFTSGNLPVGLQIAGKPFAEETLFRVAHSYEQATEWHTLRPPMVEA